jgi:transcriptional regulator with XRE-family HTH domain
MDSANNRLADAVKAAVPNANIRSEAKTFDGLTLLEVDAGRGTIPLRAIWAGQGWPQDIARTIEVGRRSNPDWPGDVVLVARDFSPGAIEALQQLNANWVDESGRANIVAPGLIVSREVPRKQPNRREFGWSRSALDIVELLLSKPWPDGFGTSEIARSTGWSAPQVSQVLQGLDDNRWTVKHGPRRGRGAARRLIDAAGLLEAWSEWTIQTERGIVETSIVVEDFGSFLRHDLAPVLDERLRWALGGWAAAEELAPFVSTVPTLLIHVDENDFESDLSGTIEAAGLRAVAEGGRVVFSAVSPASLRRTTNPAGLPLASAPRVYADLLALGPRGIEAANHLREEVIDPMHRGPSSDGPSAGIVSWERAVKLRLQERIDPDESEMLDDRYRFGTYSTSYILQGVSPVPSLPELRKLLQRAQGQETGWPVWSLAEGTPDRARPVDGGIEAWFQDNRFRDPSHSDFWRAEPAGRLCLIRGYDEDGEDAGREGLKPGTVLDITIPLWRVGPAVRHAARLGALTGASRAEFMMRWEGLEGRKLTNFAERRRMISGEYECLQNTVETSVEFGIEEVEDRLPELVKALVAPLYAAFEFFEPPDDLYGTAIEKMRVGV